jgi:hypothetical protein
MIDSAVMPFEELIGVRLLAASALASRSNRDHLLTDSETPVERNKNAKQRPWSQWPFLPAWIHPHWLHPTGAFSYAHAAKSTSNIDPRLDEMA